MIISIYQKNKFIIRKLNQIYCGFLTRFLLYLNRIDHLSFTSCGIPILEISLSGKCSIGKNFIMINEAKISTLGKNNRCKFLVYPDAKLIIGNKVGMSNTTIVATKSITLGNNLIIGAGTSIVDSDFHSLNPAHWHTNDDAKNMQSSPVIIKNNVFIGMESIILKGVTIGENAIIAAGSVVSKDIPDNQIWGGNPAVFIKNVEK